MKLEIATLYDASHKERCHARGETFWFEYLQEILCQLGISARKITPEASGIEEKLRELKVLFMGTQHVHDYGTKGAARDIEVWVAEGGLLIGFRTEGLDHVFGNTHHSDVTQNVDDFTASGYFDFENHPLTQGIHSVIAPDQKLLIFSDIRAVASDSSEQIAGLYLKETGREEAAAITINQVGKGLAVYFSFDVAKTFRVLHHGKPVYEGSEGPGNRWWIRSPQKTVIGAHSDKVGYADELLFLLQNIIAWTKHPFIYQLPPKDDTIPAALFHWAGDDEGDRTGIQLRASNWMKGKGLPYHINVMEVAGEKIPLTKEDAVAILENGHELSCHYNFTLCDGKPRESDKNNPLRATESEIKKQAERFEDKFGLKPLAGATHCCIWYGGPEPAKWMKNVGGIANNSNASPGHIFNGSNLGFAFGTAYPYYFYEDAKNGNDRIGFMEIPITGYELGHRASSGGDKMEVDLSEAVMAVDVAATYHLIFNMFYHPVYIHEESGARKAIEGFLDTIAKKEIPVVHMGTNAVAEWWNKRRESSVSNVCYDRHTWSFDASCAYKEGMIIKIPVDEKAMNLRIDDQERAFETKEEFGYTWLYFICPWGDHRVQLIAEGSMEWNK